MTAGSGSGVYGPSTGAVVLHVETRFAGRVVDERFVSVGEQLRVGVDDVLGRSIRGEAVFVPVRDGGPHVAKVGWRGGVCVVIDAAGEPHEVRPTEPARFASGEVTVEIRYARRQPLPWFVVPSVGGGLAWFTIVLLTTLVTTQAVWVGEHFCPGALELLPHVQEVGGPLAWLFGPAAGAVVAIVALVVADSWRTVVPALAAPVVGVIAPLVWTLGGFHWRSGDELLADELHFCIPPETGGRSGAWTADYLARLLRNDLEGEEAGVIEDDPQRPDHARDAEGERSYYMPAGSTGPTDRMGGASETTLNPVRTVIVRSDPELLRRQRKRTVEVAPGDQPTPRPDGGEEELDVPGADVAEAEEEEEGDRVPSEEDQGWGIPGWYDELDREMERQEIELVLRIARQRVRIDPDDPAGLSILSYYQYLAQDYDKALETYDRLLKLDPEDAASWNNKALVYKREGDYKTEEMLYRKSLQLEPDDDTAMNNLAVNLSHQHRFEEALALMEEVGRLIPGDPYADLHRAKIYAEMGNDEEAYRFLRLALTGMQQLDTLHHIEFRQDIRLDPSFGKLRKQARFKAILVEFYGERSPLEEGPP